LVQQVKAYEKLTVEAAVHGDVEEAFFALLNHPLVPGADAAKAILKDILEANKEFLPQFKGKAEAER
jgi:6-phospho-beta-glucosidase